MNKGEKETILTDGPFKIILIKCKNKKREEIDKESMNKGEKITI